MFINGEEVRVTVDWLPVPVGSQGEVIGEVFHNPLTSIVRFRSGMHLIPTVLLERTLSAGDLASSA